MIVLYLTLLTFHIPSLELSHIVSISFLHLSYDLLFVSITQVEEKSRFCQDMPHKRKGKNGLRVLGLKHFKYDSLQEIR